MIVSVGINVSKDQHNCFIVSSKGEGLADVFTIPNAIDGSHSLLQQIQDYTYMKNKIKVGLEATGHYSYNILGFFSEQRSGHLCPEFLTHKPLPEKAQSLKD